MVLTPEYIAGFFDGEGCIGIYNGVLRIEIAGCYKPIFEELEKHYGYGGVHGSKAKEELNVHRKPKYRYIIQKRDDVKKFLLDISDHLHEKKYQVDTALMYLTGSLSMATADRVLREAKRQQFELTAEYLPKKKTEKAQKGPSLKVVSRTA